jgi:peptidoglycan/LPS O-acetylase OafA/YrhL
MAEDKRYIRSHCGLRGIAASLVIAYHLKFGTNYLLPMETATSLFKRGYLWVDLFFILSGFIISFTARAASERFTAAEVVSFFRHRVTRIYPLHVFCLLYLAIALGGLALLQTAIGTKAADPHWTAGGALSLITELLLVHAWGVGHEITWNVPSWSISAEMFAYLLFPLLYAVGHHQWGRWWMMAMSLAFYAYIALTSGDLDTIGGVAPIRCLAGFMVGMEIFRARECFRAISDRASTAIQVVASVAILVLLAIPVNDVFLIAPFALLVGSTWHDRGVVARALAARPLQLLGDLSYSIYLNHFCVIQILGFFWVHTIAKIDLLPPAATRLAWIIGVYGATLLMSHFTYRYIEQSARRAIMSNASYKLVLVARPPK